MKTDVELVRETHEILMLCLKERIACEDAVIAVVELHEAYGHPFHGKVDRPANED
jgi:hypothetical protein